MPPSRRKTHLYCNPSRGCLQAITMHIQSAAQGQSAKLQQAKHWLSQLHASCSPGPSHLLKQHKLQHTAGKHAVASSFSVQTVRPVLRIVVNYKGTKVLNLGSSTCLYCRSLQGHWQNHCFTTSVEPLALGSSPAGLSLCKLQECFDPSSSRQGLKFRLHSPFSSSSLLALAFENAKL